jgi:DNA polymerase I-like protein with 3'-5' exonuclease and polymerase domains
MSDIDLPLRILEKQRAEIAVQGLTQLWDIESGLIPMLLAMRQRGVRVDVDGAGKLDHRLMEEAHAARKILTAEGIDPNVREGIAAYCDRKKIPYWKTATGLPSFTSPWFAAQDDELLGKIQLVRKLEKHAGTFLQGHVLTHQINGRVHCEFNQLRGDEYGTVSGRFSSSNPNLQNIPSRDEELAPLVRGMFLPEEGEDWYSDDWSQIEYRLLVHYGRGGKSVYDTQQQYRENPKTDFHVYVSELTGVPRKPAKNINFGLVYGMGEKALAARLGRSVEEAREIFDQYHGRLPFVKATYDEASRIAASRGYIHTILGRRRRFKLYEPSDWSLSSKLRAEGKSALPEAAARELWGDAIRRAYTHKALNSILQGSSADIMKKAMLDIWNSGVCSVLGAPLITVHDELDWSVPRTLQGQEAHATAVRIMENCITLNVPLLCDSSSGPNWGAAG